MSDFRGKNWASELSFRERKNAAVLESGRTRLVRLEIGVGETE